MTRSEPRLAWTTPSGAAVPDAAPLRSRDGAREALWALGLSVFVHAGLLGGLGSIVLAARIRSEPTVLEVAVVAAAEAPPAPIADPAETVAPPQPPPELARPAATADAPSPIPPETPPPEPKAPELKPPEPKAPELKAPEIALPEATPNETASEPAEPPPKPPPPAPPPRPPHHVEPPAARPQIAARPPPLPSARGVDGITNAKPTELSPTASFRPVVAPPLTYPRIAIQLGEEGTVGLLVEIDAEGTPTEVTVQRSSGFGSLDEEAVRTMRRWRFSAPLKNGQAAPVTIYIPMVFKLKHHDG